MVFSEFRDIYGFKTICPDEMMLYDLMEDGRNKRKYKSNDLYNILNIVCFKLTGQYLPEEFYEQTAWKYVITEQEFKYSKIKRPLGIYKNAYSNILAPNTNDTFSQRVNRKIIVDEIKSLFEYDNQYDIAIMKIKEFIESREVRKFLEKNFEIVKIYCEYFNITNYHNYNLYKYLVYTGGEYSFKVEDDDDYRKTLMLLIAVRGYCKEDIDIEKYLKLLNIGRQEEPKSFMIYKRFLRKYNEVKIPNVIEKINRINPNMSRSDNTYYFKNYQHKKTSYDKRWTYTEDEFCLKTPQYFNVITNENGHKDKVFYATSSDIEMAVLDRHYRNIKSDNFISEEYMLEIYTKKGFLRKRTNNIDKNTLIEKYVNHYLNYYSKYYLQPLNLYKDSWGAFDERAKNFLRNDGDLDKIYKSEDSFRKGEYMSIDYFRPEPHYYYGVSGWLKQNYELYKFCKEPNYKDIPYTNFNINLKWEVWEDSNAWDIVEELVNRDLNLDEVLRIFRSKNIDIKNENIKLGYNQQTKILLEDYFNGDTRSRAWFG